MIPWESTRLLYMMDNYRNATTDIISDHDLYCAHAWLRHVPHDRSPNLFPLY
jgi:hypothetical protein